MAQKIVIVDDELDVLKVTAFRLRKTGYEIVTASDGNEALSVISREKPDLVLLDMRLPGLSGEDVCVRLKRADATKHIPVVFLTASSNTVSAAKVASVGAQGLVMKPFDYDQLCATVRSLIG